MVKLVMSTIAKIWHLRRALTISATNYYDGSLFKWIVNQHAEVEAGNVL